MKNKNRIKELRKEGHHSQSDLAKAIGVTRQAISRYEHGSNPSLRVCMQMADFFQVSLDYLLGRD